ncbi:uncharacterized protein LOC129247865 isoform X1 [Anastrepha obliqua]|uniref:uncharacterized protein LOC129247865 isoform X1 n=2 Tax=Anastrepha obliqua TaxID=95512 RepID=UPI002409F3F8|nr:uncharacterized protein LOC129247865 isoform X1 [Anastrepha obliqua]
MSGLEKFQANKAWRAKVKKLLFMQRELTPPASAPMQCQRFSLDITEDLQVFLEEKTFSREEIDQTRPGNIEEKMFETENDENKPINTNATSNYNTTKKAIPKKFSTKPYCDETMYEDQQQAIQWQRFSDESFMALEKMCDKTASDPNSTLFQYINSEHKELIVEDAKKRSGDGKQFITPCKNELREIDEEAKSLQRLLHDLCVQEQKELEKENPIKGIDITRLEDIEAPSKLWDTTIMGETTLQTSPVKMIGLLRPSTIMEECAEDESINSLSGCEDASPQVSFQSAAKGSETSTTSYYETAHDTTGSSAISKVSHIVEKTPTKQSEVFDQSLELIYLDKTLEPQHQRAAEAELGKEELKIVNNIENQSPASSFDDSEGVIELLSDDESDDVIVNANSNIVVKNEIAKEDFGTYPKDNSILHRNTKENEFALHDVKSTELIDLEKSFEVDNEKENCGVFNESSDQSLHFNDTMEEVEYMMKKGMQYMAAAETTNCGLNKQSPVVKEIATVQPVMIVKPLQEKERTFTYSPKKGNSNYSSPYKNVVNCKPTATVTGTKAKLTASSPRRTPTLNTQKTKRFLLDMKPLTKLDLFKTPSSISMRLKEPAGHKQFAHIVSPIGAYIKNTATTPLMANLKQRSDGADVRSATVFRKLEQETEIDQLKSGPTVSTVSKTSSLPKKAYITSELKHIVDERTPMTIPGGEKIQKYLENAMLPTVVRHEGKLKISSKETNPEEVAQKASFGNTTQRNNGSLANLSLMSGDISLYTMKDARKF